MFFWSSSCHFETNQLNEKVKHVSSRIWISSDHQLTWIIRFRSSIRFYVKWIEVSLLVYTTSHWFCCSRQREREYSETQITYCSESRPKTPEFNQSNPVLSSLEVSRLNENRIQYLDIMNSNAPFIIRC